MERRSFLRKGLTITAGSVLIYRGIPNEQMISSSAHFSLRRLTNGPNFHWFGYYDKLQCDPSGRYVLGMEVPFEMRSPAASDEIRIGMIDLENDRWIELGSSCAWSWQQGCMLQWIPGSDEEIVWNDRSGDHFVSHILNIRTRKKRTLPKAVYALSPDGKWAVGTEFSRIQDLRPGYGYPGIRDPYYNIKAPAEIGLYKIDLGTGESKLLLSIADLAAIKHKGEIITDNFHWFNHLLVNTDGSRFTFLHRWRKERTDRQKMATGGFITRMITASSSGDDLFIIDPSGFTSHFVWRDTSHICAWTQPDGENPGFWLLEDKTGKFSQTGKGKMVVNGHNTYVPGTDNNIILCDTYPKGEKREQELYLYNISSDNKIIQGNFTESSDYAGEWRCDLHPKCTPDGRKIIFDSTHEGYGRQIYLLDIK